MMALEMLDELTGWGPRPPLLTADAGYGQVAEFRQGLTERGISYIVATTSSTTAQPGDARPVQVPYAGVGRRPTPRYPTPARSVKAIALTHGADATRLVRWRMEHDYRELKTALGLDHFEGRSWIGWHRHVTLAATAQLFLTQLRLAEPKAVGQT